MPGIHRLEPVGKSSLAKLVNAAMPNTPSKLFNLTNKDCNMCDPVNRATDSMQANTAQQIKVPYKLLSVEEHFDKQIAETRKHLETLCIKKAKLEALQLHKLPFDDLTQLLNLYPF